MPAPVIDMWAPVLPVPEIMAHIAEHFPDAMLGYLRVFWKQRPSQQALRAGAPALARPLSEVVAALDAAGITRDRKSTRLNSSHSQISYAVFCLKKKKTS